MAVPSVDHLQLPPGFRFHPTDEELIVHYLMNKVSSNPLPASIVADLDLYKFNPWDLPGKALFGEEEWYFFTPRNRKYPNGARPNRGAASGYWKATGTDKPILTTVCGLKTSIGVKKGLVFYKGRPPKGTKTEWIMHEYRLPDPIIWAPKKKGSMRLDDWVLCRVKQKSCISRGNSDDQNGHVSEQPSYFTEANPDNINEMMKNPFFNECPMLPFIFTGQDNLPKLELDPSYTSLQNMDKSSLTSVFNKNATLNATNSCFNNVLNNSLKREAEVNNQQRRRIFVAPSKKMGKGDQHEKEEVISIINVAGSDMNISEIEKHFEGNNFNPDRWDSIIQYQELSDLTFVG
ncbi:hypothetical protein ACFE04_020406 [Oxalis oulophora]